MNLVLNPEPEQQPARLQPPKPIRWPFAVTAIGAALFCLGYLAGKTGVPIGSLDKNLTNAIRSLLQ